MTSDAIDVLKRATKKMRKYEQIKATRSQGIDFNELHLEKKAIVAGKMEFFTQFNQNRSEF